MSTVLGFGHTLQQQWEKLSDEPRVIRTIGRSCDSIASKSPWAWASITLLPRKLTTRRTVRTGPFVIAGP